MKVVLRTNEDDWRELDVETYVGTELPADVGTGYAGHKIPEWYWIRLLNAAGVTVEVVFDDFERVDLGLDILNFENEGGQQ